MSSLPDDSPSPVFTCIVGRVRSKTLFPSFTTLSAPARNLRTQTSSRRPWINSQPFARIVLSGRSQRFRELFTAERVSFLNFIHRGRPDQDGTDFYLSHTAALLRLVGQGILHRDRARAHQRQPTFGTGEISDASLLVCSLIGLGCR